MNHSPSAPRPARSSQLDICRGLAILAVLFIHVSGHFLPALRGPKALSPNWVWDALAIPNQCFQWAVPCFLMLSALVNAQSLARGGDIQKYARRRVQTALLPYLLWSGVYMAVNYALGSLHHLSLGHVAKLLLTGTAHFHLYFFVLVLEMYALLPLAVPLFQRRPPFWAVALGGTLLQLAVYGLNRFVFPHRFQATIFWDILPVALGLWLFSQPAERGETIRRRGRWTAGAVVLAALAVYEPLALHLLAFPKQHINTFAYQQGQWGFTAGISFLMLILAYDLGWNGLTKLLVFFGRESLAIYVLHPLAIILLDRLGVTHHLGSSAGLAAYYAACLALPLAAAGAGRRIASAWKKSP